MSSETACSNLLHVAVFEDDELAVRFLLKHGADVNSRMSAPVQLQRLTIESTVPGEIFARRRSGSFSKYFLMASSQPLSACCTHEMNNSLGHRRNSSSLSLSGSITEIFKPLFSQNYHNHQYYQSKLKHPTSLHVAAANAKKAIVEQLIKYGGDVNVEMEGYYGDYTPLIIAIFCRRYDVTELLLQHGAHVNVRTKNGKTPLHFAVKTKDADLVRLLLKNGADMKACTEQGVTPLHVAVERKLYAVAELLLKHGADVNARTKTGVTPLQCAAVRGQREMTEMILSFGGDVTCIMKKGEIDVTPLLWVTESERTKIIDLLNKYKSKTVTTSSTGGYGKFIMKIWERISGRQ